MAPWQRTPQNEPVSTGTLVARVLLVAFVFAGVSAVIWYATR
jgi:hypothetical protein